MSRKVLLVALTVAAVRLAAFFVILLNQPDDAQWQLSYFPLWISDFPISLLYFLVPIPWAEAIIGPLWWFALPVMISGLFHRPRARL